MKKIFLGIACLLFLTGCTGNDNKTVNNDLPKHHLYYVENDYQNNSTSVIDVNVASGYKKTLLNANNSALMINYDNGKIYAIFTNRIGYINNGKIKYITSEDEYVARYDVNDNKVYYGKDNNNMSDNIFERLAMEDADGKNEKIINEAGISQLLVDDYIYYKPSSGSDVLNLLRYNLDGTNKKILYTGSVGQLAKFGDYLYFINYNDSTSLYRIKRDGTEPKKMIQGPLNFGTAYANQVNGYNNIGVIDNYLYYINPNDSNKVYKTDGTNNEKIIDASATSIYIKDNYIYCNFADYNKMGIYLLDSTGKEIKKIVDYDYGEYIVN